MKNDVVVLIKQTGIKVNYKYHFFEEVTSHDENNKLSYYQELANKLIKFRVLTQGKLEDLGLKELADEIEAVSK